MELELASVISREVNQIIAMESIGRVITIISILWNVKQCPL